VLVEIEQMVLFIFDDRSKWYDNYLRENSSNSKIFLLKMSKMFVGRSDLKCLEISTVPFLSKMKMAEIPHIFLKYQNI